ncbi:helix-turn-helix domain-containing protein [uncultured Croceitalea sp.]|uniref:helix-turn-helix domain-containing protein n=1 Tax=uncultured Croceitalea sp. TaxID=1798908 RepID=UPI00330683CC
MDTFISIAPKNEQLKKLILYYYFHKSDSKTFKKSIIYHPHFVTGLNIYRNSKIIWDENGRTYEPSSGTEPSITLTINPTKSKVVHMRGAFDKIGIIFHPLGINNFIGTTLSSLVVGRITEFKLFNPDIFSVAKTIYNTKDIEKKRDALDSFFCARHLGFSDSRIVKAVQLLTMHQQVLPKCSDLAKATGVSRETLLRLFKRHLGCSVEQFKLVVKFRKALQLYQTSSEALKLTQLAIDSTYYDQSSLIHHFKTVTGFNPKAFFSNLEQISVSGTYWTMME